MAALLAGPALLVPDVVDGRADAALGQHPALVRQAADQVEFQPLVDFLGLVVVAEHVGGQGQGELCRPASRVAPFETCRE